MIRIAVPRISEPSSSCQRHLQTLAPVAQCPTTPHISFLQAQALCMQSAALVWLMQTLSSRPCGDPVMHMSRSAYAARACNISITGALKEKPHKAHAVGHTLAASTRAHAPDHPTPPPKKPKVLPASLAPLECSGRASGQPHSLSKRWHQHRQTPANCITCFCIGTPVPGH